MNYSINRIANVVVGSGLILTAMVASSAPLGALATLPLVGAALVLVGIYGENPLHSAGSKLTSKTTKLVNGASYVRAHTA